MIKYVVKRNNCRANAAYGKYYAHPVVEETIDLAGLARHMEDHNSGFSEAMCIGVMKAMVKCIKEQLLEGKNVKIDNLAIFSCGIKNKEGALSEEAFSTSGNISGVKLRARATGTLSNASLNLSASLKKASNLLGASGNGGVANGAGDSSNASDSSNSSNSSNTGNTSGSNPPPAGGSGDEEE